MIVLKKGEIKIVITQERSATENKTVHWIWFRSYRKDNLNYGMWHRIDTQEGRKNAAFWASSLLKEHETEKATFWVAFKNRIKNIFKT